VGTLSGNSLRKYDQALQHLKNYEETLALKIFEELESTDQGYRVLASLQKAALLGRRAVLKGEKAAVEEAQVAYENLRQVAGVDAGLQGVSVYGANALLVSTATPDPVLEKQLENCVTPDNPWKGLLGRRPVLKGEKAAVEEALEAQAIRAYGRGDLHSVQNILSLLMRHSDITASLRERTTLAAMGFGLGLKQGPEHSVNNSMLFFKVSSRAAQVLGVIFCILGTAGCDFSSKKDILQGKREPVDQAVLQEFIRDLKTVTLSSLPQPAPAPDWEQPFALPSHYLGHIQFSGSLTSLGMIELGKGLHGGGQSLSVPVVTGYYLWDK